MTARTSTLTESARRRGRSGEAPGSPEAAAVRRAWRSVALARSKVGFTLLELLVVVAIIGILAASSAPAIRSLTQANAVASGSRQMLDELAFARQSAISVRRTVYVVFVPPSLRDHVQTVQDLPSSPRQGQMLRQLTNLVGGQYTAYALFTRRSVGDQPGRQTPRYLTEWKQLSEGMFFATNKFVDLREAWASAANAGLDLTNRPLPYAEFPFPAADGPSKRLPYVAFDPAGRLTYDGPAKPRFADAVLTVSRGSIIYPKDGLGRYLVDAAPDIVATPLANRTDVLVNWLTGRSRVLEAKLP